MPQSYQVVAGDGTLRRNRRDLIRLPSAEAHEAAELTSPDPDTTEPKGTEPEEQSNENSNDPPTRPTESTSQTRCAKQWP